MKARLPARRNVAKLGIAPLTSMYLYGENQRAPGDDYRPEVHDSDGLSVQLGTGEWVGAAREPKRLLVTSFGATNPLGFGLQQRDRSFASYEDLEARYELRPGAWIKPPSPSGPDASSWCRFPRSSSTTTTWSRTGSRASRRWPARRSTSSTSSCGRRTTGALAHRVGRPDAARPRLRAQPNDTTIDFHVDFEGPALKELPEKAKLDAIFTVDANGEIVEQALQRNPVTEGRARLAADEAPRPGEAHRAARLLRDESENHSETWSYIVPPE